MLNKTKEEGKKFKNSFSQNRKKELIFHSTSIFFVFFSCCFFVCFVFFSLLINEFGPKFLAIKHTHTGNNSCIFCKKISKICKKKKFLLISKHDFLPPFLYRKNNFMCVTIGISWLNIMMIREENLNILFLNTDTRYTYAWTQTDKNWSIVSFDYTLHFVYIHENRLSLNEWMNGPLMLEFFTCLSSFFLLLLLFTKLVYFLNKEKKRVKPENTTKKNNNNNI